MIDYDLLNRQMQNFNPFKEDPRDTHIKKSVKLFLENFNKQIAKAYKDKYKKEITNYPTDEMIEFTTKDNLAVLCMSQALSFIYDENSKCFILEDTLYDEHQKDIYSDNFNSLLLWTRIFSKLGMIELKRHDKENKRLEFFVKDERLINNLKDYSENDLQSIRNISKNIDLGKYNKYIEQTKEIDFKSKSDNEINKEVESMFSNILIEMMNDITKVMK